MEKVKLIVTICLLIGFDFNINELEIFQWFLNIHIFSLSCSLVVEIAFNIRLCKLELFFILWFSIIFMIIEENLGQLFVFIGFVLFKPKGFGLFVVQVSIGSQSILHFLFLWLNNSIVFFSIDFYQNIVVGSRPSFHCYIIVSF